MADRPIAFVGLSGGVDSSVAALRLKRAGFEVVGVFIRVWHPEFIVCTEEADRYDAMRVAARLEIPFMTLDAREAYRDGVALEMIREYERGRTPNPDVLCNKVVKFGVFDEFCRAHGASIMATGHYARRTDIDGEPALATARDTAKDQTYFLWMVSRALLPRISFPLGDTVKDDVRREARRAGLATAAKRDSQGICFLGKVDMQEFLSHYIDSEPGVVRDDSGAIIGSHPGALFFTIGQRHGFSVTVRERDSVPLYVVSKDLARNEIIVSRHKPRERSGARYKLSSVNLLVPSLDASRRYDVVTRYHGPRAKVAIAAHGDELSIDLASEADAVSVGQSAVLYDGDICVGGGIIDSHE